MVALRVEFRRIRLDLSQISEAIGLASSAAGATGKAADTIKTITTLFRSDKEPDKDEAARLLNTLAVELTAANMINVNISTALKKLSHALHQQDQFEQEKRRYELFKTGTNDIVFKLKSDLSNGQPDHFICPVCLNRDKLVSFISGEGDYKRCQTDKDHFFHFSDTPRDTGSSVSYF